MQCVNTLCSRPDGVELDQSEMNMSSRSKDALSRIEVWLRLAGILLVVCYLGARSYSIVFSRIGLWQLQTSQATATQPVNQRETVPAHMQVDFSLWSPKRIAAFRESVSRKLEPPIAVLRIPRLRLIAPVFEGTDDLTLNRGLGRIAGTGHPGEGNLGVAGHRDGFFRPLKEIEVGDTIEIATPSENDTYSVERTEIVTPDELAVLGPRTTAALTLVTCYPFYFVGDAPSRFIVEARLRTRNAKPSQVSPAAYR
jgi:sortase A